MRTYKTIGPTTSGNFLVIYITPGCDVPTVACICTTIKQADIESDRLNLLQHTKSKDLRFEMQQCGIKNYFPELEIE